ncbi:hypothetical protein, partial [Streptomyces sp. SID4917]|uniref:hypothetical protein n=1 Tax=Streptomyces sp. SID4917 TaxID=2690269 RepID=UPI00136903ED
APAASGAAGGAQEPVDAEFWSAVEREDLESLAASLDLDGETVTTMVPALSAWRRRRDERSAGANWRYRESWTQLPVTAEAMSAGAWLAIVPAGAEDAWTAAAVEALGADTVRVEADLSAAADDTGLVARLVSARGDGSRLTGVVSLLAAAAEELPAEPARPAAP